MPRYQFARPARAALLDQLVAAGVTVERVESNASGADTTCWVTCDPADYDKVATVVAAHDATALDAAATQAQTDDDTDRTTLRGLIATLLNDATTLADATQTLTAQQVRNRIARTDQALVAVLRYLRRRGL